MSRSEIIVNAIKGKDSNGVFYVAVVKAKYLSDLFRDVLKRTDINQANLTKIERAMRSNELRFGTSAISAITTSKLQFQQSARSQLGTLTIPSDSVIHVVNGLDACCATIRHVSQNNDFANSQVAVRFGIDATRKVEAHFAALLSVGELGSKAERIQNTRDDPIASVTLHVVSSVKYFAGRIEQVKTTISNRSTKLFTVSSLYEANRELLAVRHEETVPSSSSLCTEFWNAIGECLAEWNGVRDGSLQPASFRATYITSQGLMLRAFATLGRGLIQQRPATWQQSLKRLEKIDFARDNPVWTGRAIINGRVSKSLRAITLTSNYLKLHFGLKLSSEEQAIEQTFLDEIRR